MHQAAFDRGSFATLTTVAVDQDSTAILIKAIGDTNVFVIDEDRLVMSFPYQHTNQFSDSPNLVSSKIRLHTCDSIQFKTCTVNYSKLREPLVCVATDALAQWILDQGSNPGATLRNIATFDAASFGQLILSERAARRMKTDDTTLVVMRRL